MNQEQIDRIGKILERISDNMERDEVTREIGHVIAKAVSNFDEQRFYQLARVSYLENR